jgi:hypothetical protein
LADVFGSEDTALVSFIRRFWLFLSICIFLDYTGFLAGIGTNNAGEAILFSIVSLVGLSAIWWCFSAMLVV